MKKNALVAFGLLVSLASAGAVVGQDITDVSNEVAIVQQDGQITVEQARKIALKRVPGEIDDEYTMEDEDGNITSYVFVIKNQQGKKFDVQIDAGNGDVLSANEQEIDEESTEPEEVEEEPTESEEVENTEEVDSTEPADEVESTETEEVETNVSDEDESTETDSNVTNEDEESEEVTMNDDDNDVKLKVTMDQARTIALKKAKGEIQSEELTNADGKTFYSFVIKGKKDKMTEVRVDAVSGKAKKFKNKAAKSE